MGSGELADGFAPPQSTKTNEGVINYGWTYFNNRYHCHLLLLQL